MWNEVRIVHDLPASRPCRWCLAFYDDSVFADFDLDQEGRVLLLRISFDGYGCYHTPEARAMDSETSSTWIAMVEADDVDSLQMRSILSKYLRENSDVISTDALEDYDPLR